ncbi:transcription factor HIVEP2-like [Xyrauchen texanus]|uniref:transcription factor HIVEP2-like n=1 Tax=Xyrauchen texanus TaxID=154827 RepID=UPI0022420AB2|nr:transcription factor HIVEP2-like [Xyrauchen texanus]
MEAAKTSCEEECSEQIIIFKDDEKHLPSEMTQTDQSSSSEDKIRLAEQPQTGAVSPSSCMESKAFALRNSLTSKSREECHIHLSKKTFPPVNKRCLHSECDFLMPKGQHKKEQKSVKTGKYVCQYCGRACAKPSILKKHIRSHTGERPYPCIPCGFSFKTKSNLYKHRKSHTHAVKAGVMLFSGQDSNYMGLEELTVAEGDIDTDDEVVEDLALDASHIKDTEGFMQGKGGKLTKKEAMMLSTASSGKVSLWQFREILAPATIAQGDQIVEFPTIKQRLALRLSEKKNQDSEQSLSLPSSYSKGSTDSGYFSRSESAEQQFNQSSENAKSYQEIMFGKCYKPTTRPKQSITVQTSMADINEATSSFMIKLNKGMMPGDTESSKHRSKKDLVRSIKIDSFQEEDYQECQNPAHTNLLETASESSMFLRSNSLPTSSSSNLDASIGLRSSNSFDERMPGADVTYRGLVGMRRLMRQAAFEHSTNEGHVESDCSVHLACSLKSELKIHSIDDSKVGVENYQETESCSISQSQLSDTSRKRRKDKQVMEEEDFHFQDKPSDLSETKETILDTAFYDTERRAGSNVISVIQHTNSFNRLNSSEKSTDIRSHPLDKVGLYKFTKKEHSIEDQRNDFNCSSEGIEWQLGSSSLLHHKCHMAKQPTPQPSIQVPEIRVTVEPERPEKVVDVGVRQREKHPEEFQWPQRSETLSQFPMEKLPPKKKRLRLVEIDCSSGESSFESACTSLSRSPCQDSNLSHSSSFSQSLDREETIYVASQTNPDELNRPLEFLSVPGGSQSHHKEMRCSASELLPYNKPLEVPEIRSKSFGYGSLSPTFRQEEVTEHRRCFLVRQASLGGEQEIVTHISTVLDETSRRTTSPNKQFLPKGSIEKFRYPLISSNPFHQQASQMQTSSHKQCNQPNVSHVLDPDSIMLLIKKEPEDSKASESYISLRNHREDYSQSVGNVLSTIAVLSQAQHSLSCQNMSSFLVPVRIQMQVPSYGHITYTSISPILDSQLQNSISRIQHKTFSSQSLDTPPRRLLRSTPTSPAKLNTGIPLSLTSKTISTTEAPSGGANKRMLSPASSIELFIKAKQQKRVKDESIYGQIVKGLSAVELGNLEGDKENPKSYKSKNIQDQCEPLEEVEMNESNLELQSSASIPLDTAMMEHKLMAEHLMASHSSSIGASLLSQFSGLHATTCVSWCYLNSTKPNSTQTAAHFSEYASWFVRCHNPNPPNLSTGMVLALLRSKQGMQNAIYSIATMYQPGLLVTSTPWRLKQEQVTLEYREEDTKHEVKLRDISQRSKYLREDIASSIRQHEPDRVKIFEGGYKSNEDYVYVRGRGRGKYICEECGIRCKKPSMLKKHIRTHMDVRPYICKYCNFAFKTKGNLTKHMKSKAHMKKCLERGVSPTAMDHTKDADDILKSLDIRPMETTLKHQFSDVEDSDENGDEPDDEEGDECHGDFTPKTLSRSTSPQPYAVNKPCLSSCLMKHMDTIRNLPKEQLEASSLGIEEDLTLEQSSIFFELCPPQLLSPCWDLPLQRNISPRGDLSPKHHLLSSFDSSPLRAVSPRRDLSLRELSPVRLIHTRADPSGHQKGMLRVVSPLRGSYQHRAHVDQGRSIRYQSSNLRPIIGVQSEIKMDREGTPLNLYVPVGLCSSKDLSTTLQPDIYSHLPLHSQGQVPKPVPMIPIGGLRMPSPERNLLPSLQQENISEMASSRQISDPVPDPGVTYDGDTKTSRSGPPSKDDKKEESIYICAKAIASLRITAEDATDKPPKS